MVNFDILGEREALVVAIQPLSQEVVWITINIPGRDKTPVEVRAVVTELMLAREAIMGKTSTIILIPFPTQHVALEQVEPFHNHPDPVPYPTRHSGSHGRSGGGA